MHCKQSSALKKLLEQDIPGNSMMVLRVCAVLPASAATGASLQRSRFLFANSMASWTLLLMQVNDREDAMRTSCLTEYVESRYKGCAVLACQQAPEHQYHLTCIV